MAYFNGFPATYQPVYPVQGFNQPAQQNNGIIWVQGEAGAKSYMVAPNNTIQLWDSESQTIYLKSADASGMPSMKILDYTIRDSLKNGANTSPVITDDKLSGFATKDEIKAVSDRITALSEQVEKIRRNKDE